MTDLDELLAAEPIAAPTRAGARGRRHLRHHFERAAEGDFRCTCGAVRDETRARLGKSSRRLGHDGERRSAKRYGWRKTGQYGGIDDLEGRMFLVQQKTTRSAMPVRWKSIFARLDERAGGRIPVILLSYVHAGKGTEDLILVRGKDWIALHGTDEPEGDNP